MSTCVAVLDIGKTHKKLCCFDQRLQLIDEVSTSLPSQPGAAGLHYEQSEVLWQWYAEQLAALYRRHPFAAIAVTTHGATYALLDAAGQLTTPIVAYDSPLSEAEQQALDQAFYQRCGRLADLQEETGSCDMPLLVNPAKSLLLLEQRCPEALRSASSLLNYPQYWGYRLTGAQATEATYTANHSFLFDIQQGRPSSAARALGLEHLIDCRLRRPWDCLGSLCPSLQKVWGLPALPVAVGIHDSNAALLPYLLRYPQRDFALNSTGTWCVAMHRVPQAVYRPEERGQKIIFNIDALGQLQKTAFLMGGQDYALYHALIGGADPGFACERMDSSLADPSRAILPGAFPSQFPGWQGGACSQQQQWSLDELRQASQPDWWQDTATAHDLLNAALAVQSSIALQRTGINDQTTIFVEGGFRNNPSYLALLADIMPNPLVLTDLQQATASGTAILALALAQGKEPAAYADVLSIEEQALSPPGLSNSASYAKAYAQRLQRPASYIGGDLAGPRA